MPLFRKHPNGILYGCEHCNYKSTTKETLRKHVRKLHAADDPLSMEEEEEEEESPYTGNTYVYYEHEGQGGEAGGTLVLQATAPVTDPTFLFCEEAVAHVMDSNTCEPESAGGGSIFLVTTAGEGVGGGGDILQLAGSHVMVASARETAGGGGDGGDAAIGQIVLARGGQLIEIKVSKNLHLFVIFLCGTFCYNNFILMFRTKQRTPYDWNHPLEKYSNPHHDFVRKIRSLLV